MRFHTPVHQKSIPIPQFAERNGELVIPSAVYSQREYPNLPDTLVKVTGQNGKNIFIPLSKVKGVVSAQDY